ncbi:type II toxin-antitoxin system Phd/YefM family antitoxin [Nocardiopsis valliformis]|uniref:type II toxin-antitoxin system Phd/YefM family antitoxin n=1 Tax=Nocardiopsis valliformis TaxID=239974 RepID=UPI000344A2A2|nr:type II toxin-antitoxin system Phd/YefM family antitoxin [Nocardiopsis valliformis]
MESISLTEAAARFTELADRVQREPVDYTFTEGGRPVVVMMSADRYSSLLETLSVLTDSEARADLAESTGAEELTTEDAMAALMRERLGRDPSR